MVPFNDFSAILFPNRKSFAVKFIYPLMVRLYYKPKNV